MKALLILVGLIAINGCNSGSDTYTTNEVIPESIPTGSEVLITADNNSSITYSDIGNGAIVVDCGASQNCTVYRAEKVKVQ